MSGGQSPYNYEIDCDDPAFESSGTVGADGWIRVVLEGEPKKAASCSVTVEDAASHSDERTIQGQPATRATAAGSDGTATTAAPTATASPQAAASPSPPP